MRIVSFLIFFASFNLFACPEFKLCQGETAVSNDGWIVTIVAVKSADVVTIKTASGQDLSYETRYLAKRIGCNAAGLCVGDRAITADGYEKTITGIFGCGSTDVAIPVTSTSGGFLRYESRYLTKINDQPQHPPVCM